MTSRKALNKLAKWRTVLAGWQLGTRPTTDGETRAVRDHREATLLLRAEVTALTGLLIEKGIFTIEEFDAALEVEATELDAAFARKFPGFTATDNGITMTMPEARDTMEKLNFPL